jgi:hypothetical protein
LGHPTPFLIALFRARIADPEFKFYFKVHEYSCTDRLKFAVRKGMEILTK